MVEDADQELQIEFSPLCQDLTRDGTTVRVNIYRIPDVDDRWTLEVVGQNDAAAVWDEVFDTDEDAMGALEAALAATGIDGLTETFH